MVSAEQAARVLDLYEGADEASARQGSRALQVLMGLAAFLVALAVLLLIGYNWQDMPRWLKLALILGGVAAAHGLGWRLLVGRQSPRAEVAFLFGSLLYGAGIFLVAQIFHVNAHYPDGFWWWAIGVLPLALASRTLLLHALYVALLAIWCGTEILGFDDLGLWFFGRFGHLPNGAFTLPLLALPGFLWAYHRRSAAALALYVPLVAWWTVLQPVAWDLQEEAVFFFIGSVGALLLLLAEAHPPGSAFAVPYRLYGGLLAAGVLTGLSFYDLQQELARDVGWRAMVPSLIVLLLGIAVLGWVHRASTSSEAVADLAWRRGLPLAILLLLTLLPPWLSASTAPVLPTVVANALMLLLAFAWMRIGLREERGLPFAAGVLFFLFWSVLRYADLFGDVGGMLGASLMFFLCGAVLFGVAHFWRRRKEVRDD